MPTEPEVLLLDASEVFLITLGEERFIGEFSWRGE